MKAILSVSVVLTSLSLSLSLWLGCSPSGPTDPPPDASDDGSVDAATRDASVDTDASVDADAAPVGEVGAVRVGRLIDPLDGSVIEHAVVVIEGGRVTYVGTDASRIPSGVRVLDWTAYSAVPGLVDVHTHYAYLTDGHPTVVPWSRISQLPQPKILVLARAAALATLRTGVTTAVDKGTYRQVGYVLRDEINRGVTYGPRLFIAGEGLYQRATSGFHGADAIRAEVRRQITAGVDLIKMWADECSDDTLSCPTWFTVEEMRAAVEEAHLMNRPISIHAYHADGARNVIAAAPDTIEHPEGLGPEDLTAMLDHGITYVPTIDHNRYYRDNIAYFGFAPEMGPAFDSYIALNLDTAREAYKRGVRIAMGSDAVFSGFGENTGEINQFVKAGMSPLDILRSATIVGATTIRQQHQIGRVAPGFFADLVAVEGDPLVDPRLLVTHVRGVVRGGIVDPPRVVPPTSGDPCAAGAIIDLTSTAPGPDGAIRYVGDNRSAAGIGGLTPPNNCLNAPPGVASVGHQVALRYRMRTTATLRASTVNAGTATAVDTVVMVASACAPSATVLACSDDATNTDARSALATPSSATLAAGTEVVVLVGGFAAPGGVPAAAGAFELALREVPVVPLGGTCDPTQSANTCVAGSCVPVQATPHLGTCVADGAQGGGCRAGDPRCDASLVCTATSATAAGLCVASAAVGDACDPTNRRTACTTGSVCVPSLADITTGTCVADGAQGGRCRPGDLRCDASLTCSAASATTAGFCRASAPAGGACDRFGRSYVCPSDSVCAFTSASQGTCGTGVMETTDFGNTPATAQGPVTIATTYRAAIKDGSDIDCYSITLAAPNSGILVETSDGAGGCPGGGADTVVALYRPDGVQLDENDDLGSGTMCSRIDGRLAGRARNLPPGTYAACVWSYGKTPIDSYVLSIMPVP